MKKWSVRRAGGAGGERSQVCGFVVGGGGFVFLCVCMYFIFTNT